MSKLKSMVTSPPDRQGVVFEIWNENRQVAEISKEPDRDYEIEIYPAANNDAWCFNLHELKAMLEDGVRKLACNP